MSLETQKYTSLYQYLDDVLGCIDNPTPAQIKTAKQQYWKQWYKQYRREQRTIQKEFTLRFDAENMKLINQKKGTQSISQFLYTSIQQAVTSEQYVLYDTALLKNIDHQLMHLINLLEELLNTDKMMLDEALLEKIEVLEQQFSEFFNTKKP